MYAVVISGGKQYRVSEGSTLVVDRVHADVGAELVIDQVLMIGGDNVQVGAPTVEGAKVRVTVVSHDKGEKTESLKYRRRSRNRTTRNGRASLTVLQINGIEV